MEYKASIVAAKLGWTDPDSFLAMESETHLLYILQNLQKPH